MTIASLNVLDRVAAGDPSAMDDCLARYGGLVWSIARRLSATATDAEDAVQEIFIDVWRSAGRFDASIASEPTFVATIARRRLIDRQRRLARQPPTAAWDQRELPQPAADAADWLQTCDDAARARDAMRKLSAEQQRVLQLAIDGGCTQSEIAERLEMPIGTVKTHARRGLTRLRELMASATSGNARGGAR